MKHEREWPKREVWVQTYEEPTVALVRLDINDLNEAMETVWHSYVVLPQKAL
jgi:hypothetical protein